MMSQKEPKIVVIPASDKAQKAYQKLKGLWEAAMLTVPGFARRGLDCQHINEIPEYSIDADQVLRAQAAKHEVNGCTHRMAIKDGVLQHVIAIPK
jgi:hypothetical protein